MKMTNEEAIKRMRKRICCEKPIQHFCTDNCMYGVDECEIAIAIDAIDKQIPDKWIENFDGYETIYTCPKCKEDFVTMEGTPADNLWNYCPKCGQRLDWGGEREDNDGNRRNC